MKKFPGRHEESDQHPPVLLNGLRPGINQISVKGLYHNVTIRRNRAGFNISKRVLGGKIYISCGDFPFFKNKFHITVKGAANFPFGSTLLFDHYRIFNQLPTKLVILCFCFV
jgi:hypothetical protein